MFIIILFKKNTYLVIFAQGAWPKGIFTITFWKENIFRKKMTYLKWPRKKNARGPRLSPLYANLFCLCKTSTIFAYVVGLHFCIISKQSCYTTD